jgi:hypothetical protein
MNLLPVVIRIIIEPVGKRGSNQRPEWLVVLHTLCDTSGKFLELLATILKRWSQLSEPLGSFLPAVYIDILNISNHHFLRRKKIVLKFLIFEYHLKIF